MFGMGLGEKTRRVLSSRFNYEVEPQLERTFRMTLRLAKTIDADEYFAALTYMKGYMGLMEPGAPGARERISDLLESFEAVRSEVPTYRNAYELDLKRIRETHGLVDKYDFDAAYPTYEDWFMAFKVACSEANSLLPLDDDGRGLVDFYVQTGFMAAYADRCSPLHLGQRFGEDFELPPIK